MNFAWHKFRHLIAVSLSQSIILSQTCAVTIAAQPAGDENPNAQKSISMASPVPLPPPPVSPSKPGTAGNTSGTSSEQTTGLKFTISPGKPTDDSEPMPPVAHTKPLSDEETNKLLKLLPPMVEEKGKAFVLPGKSLPPPNKQNRLNIPFPPHEQKTPSPPRQAILPLKITNRRPSSDVTDASEITITFSQPMVPVATQSSLEAKTPPVSFTPAIDGRWRWSGTKTLTFEPSAKRLPMSTRYDLTVPAGTTAETGGKLATEIIWHFSTSTVQLASSYPSSDMSVRPSTLIMARFNQKINKESILAMTQLSAGKRSLPVVAASQSEIDSDPILKEQLKDVPQNTFVVFKAASPLPLATRLAVKIGPNIKSAEGPLLSKNAATFEFGTYGPFKVLPQTASDKIVRPDSALSIQFSNHVDPKTVNKSTVVVSPPIPDTQLVINDYSDYIYINGDTKPNSVYQVQLKPGLKDIYGQALVGKEHTLKFAITSVDKQLYAAEQMTVFAGERKPKFAVSTVNLNAFDMRIYSVSPKDYPSYERDRKGFARNRKPIHTETIKVKNIAEQLVVTNLDLSPWLKNNRGSLVVNFESRDLRDHQLFDWVQVTNIGLDAFSDGHSVKAWVTELSNGRPIKGAKVSYASGKTSYQTDEHGLVTIPVKDGSNELLIANYSNDTAFIFENYWFSRSYDYSNYIWYVVTDRSPYRPGEKINVKGTLRRRLPDPKAMPTIPEGIKNLDYRFEDSRGNEIGKGKTKINKFGGFDLSFTLPEKVNLGELNLVLTSSEKAPGEDIYPTNNVRIQVSEFRRPEFELKVANDGPSVHIIKGSTTISATTNYFAGGNLAHADIDWTATSTSATYSPPGWSEYLFGKSLFRYFDFLFADQKNTDSSQPQSLRGTTNGAGKDYLKVDYLDVHPSEPSNLTISATVQDVNRQTWTDSTTLLVHPSELYVGTKLDTYYVKKDATIPMSCIVTNIDGKAVENVPVKIELFRPIEQTVNGKLVNKKDDLQTLNITSGTKPVEIKMQPKLGGSYQVVASVLDSSGRRNETITTFYCDAGAAHAEANPEAKFNLQKLILLPEKNEYTPGDTAKFLIQSPFYPAEGLATVWHNGRVTSMPFHMEGGSYNLEVPIAEYDVPEIGLQVDLVGIESQNEKTKDAPAEATGSVTIDVSTKHKKLTVVANPDAASAAPGQEVSINVDVTDNQGSAVADAEVTLAVVDDALLSLLNYKFSDPLQAFYPHPKTDGMTVRGRENLDMMPFLKKPIRQKMSELNKNGGSYNRVPAPMACPASPLPGGAGNASMARATYNEMSRSSADDGFKLEWGGNADKKKGGALARGAAMSAGLDSEPNEEGVSVQLRSNFDALAQWAPSVVTDDRGHAVVKFKLPDNLTRYRIMAVASHADTDFGSGDSALTARLPLMVKPSAPRFLNYGDKFELPIVLRNQTDAPIEVDVAARSSNAQFTDGQGRHTTIAANDRVEVRLPASTVKSGTAKFQVVALSGTNSDAAEFSLPVYTPATTEAFATYGQIIDNGGVIAQSVEPPQDVIPDYGSLELTTSTTVLETLTDAYIYLLHYPYECSEQISSRLISISLMKDMLKQFHSAGVPSDAEIAKTVSSDLKKLKSRQRYDGSFKLWSSEDLETYPYVTLNVAQALILAKQAGYKVDSEMLDETMKYLRNINEHIKDYTGSARTDLKAMAIYLRDKNGDSDISAAHTLFVAQSPDKLSLEALGYLLQVFAHKDQSSKDAVAIYTYLNNCVVETASTAEIVRGHEGLACHDYRLFDSPSKVKAIMLDSLIAEGKSPETVTKLMRSLLGGQVKGRWRNTQENANVLLAMRHYFDKYEKTVPDLLAEAWLGKNFIGESSFKGRSNDFKTISIPMGYLCNTGAHSEDLILKKSGSGRLYYRLGLNYAPKSLQLPSIDRGFSVTRTYEGVKKKDDVTKNSDGVWQFKAGSLVKVKVTVTATSERFFVAVVDPLPAGAESLNQDLKGAETVNDKNSNSLSNNSSDSRSWGWRWWNTWWNHENQRDNETEVFADQLWGGTHEYDYLIRATTPGRYVVPPTKAEEMYAPETFGRTATETVVIE